MSSSTAVAAVHGYRMVGPFYIIGETLPRPPVFIFGWMNGKLQYVLKYAKFYQERGHPVIVRLSNSSEFFFGGLSLKTAVPCLQDLGVFTNRKVIFHAFSNGGTTELLKLTTHLKSRNLALTPQAIILDSCPGRGETSSALQAFTHGMTGFRKLFAVAGLRFFFFLLRAWNFLTGTKETIVERAAKNIVSRKGGPYRAPRLYLYSKTDPLVKFHHVEEYQEMTRRDGDDVMATRFEDSEHVKHAVKYPEIYWGAVEKILKRTEEEPKEE
ncbi:hypothetical protein HDU96_000094 [Phlyctochytrium bullatum]|nr:hypothetical protein HDU96_000094 [Phlyctochytrium bullatum]